MYVVCRFRHHGAVIMFLHCLNQTVSHMSFSLVSIAYRHPTWVRLFSALKKNIYIYILWVQDAWYEIVSVVLYYCNGKRRTQKLTNVTVYSTITEVTSVGRKYLVSALFDVNCGYFAGFSLSEGMDTRELTGLWSALQKLWAVTCSASLRAYVFVFFLQRLGLAWRARVYSEN